MEIVHALLFIKMMRPLPQLIATYFYLKATYGLGNLASLEEKPLPYLLVLMLLPDRQLHDFTNLSSMMQLVFHPQIDATYYLALPLINQAGISFVFYLRLIYPLKVGIRKHPFFHFANQRIHDRAIGPFRHSNPFHTFVFIFNHTKVNIKTKPA